MSCSKKESLRSCGSDCNYNCKAKGVVCSSSNCKSKAICSSCCNCNCSKAVIFVGKKVPDIHADVVRADNQIDKFSLYSEFSDADLIVLFFYPHDFTFVCPTEILSMHNRISEFDKRNVKVFGISTDSVYSHLHWKKTSVVKAGIGNIDYALISDLSHDISKMFNVYDYDKHVAMRGTFIIDKGHILRHMSINDLGIGRNFDEIIRLIDSINHHKTTGDVCPANWNVNNKDSIHEDSQSVADFLSSHGRNL